MNAEIIFTKDVKICTGLFWYKVAAGTIAKCIRMYAPDAAEVECKNTHGETVRFVQTFIGAQSKFADCRFYQPD